MALENMENSAYLIKQARMVLSKLERISADSVWAHRSSGQRGAILRLLEKIENGAPPSGAPVSERKHDLMRLDELVKSSYLLLEKAAQEYYKPSRK
jgi:hypothetical protein